MTLEFCIIPFMWFMFSDMAGQPAVAALGIGDVIFGKINFAVLTGEQVDLLSSHMDYRWKISGRAPCSNCVAGFLCRFSVHIWFRNASRYSQMFHHCLHSYICTYRAPIHFSNNFVLGPSNYPRPDCTLKPWTRCPNATNPGNVVNN